MELRAHHIVVVSGQNSDGTSRLPVPNPAGHVIWSGEQPREVCVEMHGSNEVQVSFQCEFRFVVVVIPHSDDKVIASWREKGLGYMKLNGSHGSFMFFEILQQSFGFVVKKLYGARVERSQ